MIEEVRLISSGQLRSAASSGVERIAGQFPFQRRVFFLHTQSEGRTEWGNL